MAWVVKRQKLNFKKVFFWNTLVTRQMWKATDPILEKLSCEGTRRAATGGQSITRSGETTIEGDIELCYDCDLIDPMLFQNIKSAAGDILHCRLRELGRTGT